MNELKFRLVFFYAFNKYELIVFQYFQL